MRRFLLISAVLLIGLAIGGYVFFNGERKAPVRYRTAVIERGSVVSIVTATGSINPVVSVQVGTQVSGMIKSLHADFNSIVKAGDIVAVIDPEPFRARRDQAASNLEMAKANVARAKNEQAQRQRELNRAKSLAAQQFVSQNEVDMAVTNAQGADAQVSVSMAQVKQAEAALNAADLDLRYTTIRSPVNGIVVARNVEVGQTVAASFATPNLFLIALDLTKMQVDTYVSESDIGGITEGKEASFTVDAYPGVPFAGTIRQVTIGSDCSAKCGDLQRRDRGRQQGPPPEARHDSQRFHGGCAAGQRTESPQCRPPVHPAEIGTRVPSDGGHACEGGSRRSRGPGRRSAGPSDLETDGQRRAVGGEGADRHFRRDLHRDCLGQRRCRRRGHRGNRSAAWSEEGR